MIRKKILVKNPSGIHIKPMLDISKISNKYLSEIKIMKNGMSRDAKNFFEMAEGDFISGSIIYLEAEGDDEKEVFQELYNYIINLKD